MIAPIRLIAARTQCCKPRQAFSASESYKNATDRFQKGEKLNINCCGTREYSVNGQKLDVLA